MSWTASLLAVFCTTEGQLVAMIFSFLETMRLQGKNAVEELFNLLAGERSPLKTDFTPST